MQISEVRCQTWPWRSYVMKVRSCVFEQSNLQKKLSRAPLRKVQTQLWTFMIFDKCYTKEKGKSCTKYTSAVDHVLHESIKKFGIFPKNCKSKHGKIIPPPLPNAPSPQHILTYSIIISICIISYVTGHGQIVVFFSS